MREHRRIRVLAAGLTLALTLGLAAPLGMTTTAGAAVSASDARAYLDILDSTETSSSYLLDFDGDGREELVTTYFVQDFFGSYSVYQGETALLKDAVSTDVANLSVATVYSGGGTYYIRSSEGIYSTVENGRWVDVYGNYLEGDPVASWGSNPEFSEEQLAAIEYIAHGQRVSQEEYLRQVQSLQRQFPLDETKSDMVPSARPQLEAALYGGMTPGELLAQMAYVGDRSQCRMTAEQAGAYADVLERVWADWLYHEGYDAEPTMKSEAVLFDVGGGHTALLLSGIDGRNASSSYTRTALWEYVDGQLEERSGMIRTEFYPGAIVFYGRMGSTVGYRYQNGRICAQPFITGGGGRPLYYYTEEPFLQVIPPDGTTMEGDSGDDFQTRIYFVDQKGGLTRTDKDFPDLLPFSQQPLRMTSVYEGVDPKGEVHRMISLLRAYAAADHAPQYPLFSDILGSGWETEPVKAASAAVTGEPAACYSLTDGMCYVLFETEGGCQGVLVQANRRNGRVVWEVLRTDAAPAAQEELTAEADRFLSAPNLTLDFDRLRQDQDADGLAQYLRSLLGDMTGKEPNDLAKRDLAAFVDGAVSSLTTRTVTGNKNLLRVDKALVGDLSQEGRSAMDALNGVLAENGVELNRTLVPRLRMVWSDVDWDRPCQVDLSAETAGLLEGEELRIILGAADTYLQMSAEDLQELTQGLDGLSVQLSREGEGVYALRFLDGDENVVDQLDRPVTVSLPAAGELSTVMIRYAGGSDNWGGQYDPASGGVSFEARYSGEYEVLKNDVALLDVDGLSDESRAAIAFMVSRGYLSAPEGQFRPGDPLNRYEFTEALVGMFFALDRELTVEFPDVPKGSGYYAYVASAQAKGIVNGYSDGTFSGEDPITREQVFALAARTLMEQKGYAQMEEYESYLASFGDRGEISGWAEGLVAMAVRDGIASRGGALFPQANVTREQAAVILYRLFQLLYEVSPVALEVSGERTETGGGGTAVILTVCAVVAAAALAGVVILLRKKPQTAAPEQAASAGERHGGDEQ